MDQQMDENTHCLLSFPQRVQMPCSTSWWNLERPKSSKPWRKSTLRFSPTNPRCGWAGPRGTPASYSLWQELWQGLRGWGKGARERQRGWEDTEFWIAERGVVSGCLCNGKRQYSSGCARPSAYSSGISDCFFSHRAFLSLCAHLLAHGVHSDWLTPELPKAANPEGAWKARWEGIRQHPSAMEETVFV